MIRLIIDKYDAEIIKAALETEAGIVNQSDKRRDAIKCILVQINNNLNSKI